MGKLKIPEGKPKECNLIGFSPECFGRQRDERDMKQENKMCPGCPFNVI
ncbi:MAG: hypothetical protein PF572_01855 [Patescibacteria group bacterium]|jgi:hypothetical protein|nr:hypothetical protein [Patescibacteria group bacterium]